MGWGSLFCVVGLDRLLEVGFWVIVGVINLGFWECLVVLVWGCWGVVFGVVFRWCLSCSCLWVEFWDC